jgi:hypothetical protein
VLPVNAGIGRIDVAFVDADHDRASFEPARPEWDGSRDGSSLDGLNLVQAGGGAHSYS